MFFTYLRRELRRRQRQAVLFGGWRAARLRPADALSKVG
jgi:hypothetical protein